MTSRALAGAVLAALALACGHGPEAVRSEASASKTGCVPPSARGNRDAVAALLDANAICPANVLEFRARLEREPAKIASAFVDNHGFHNGAAGSFSLFETVVGTVAGVRVAPGDFFFGHFTAQKGTELVLDQAPEVGALMIELIAWDPGKGLFNFYELRGDGTRGQWFYRGDSEDILRDNASLHRQDDPEHPVFGQRLRCSGCHGGGGPIMKELTAPHNDWWTSARPLPLAGLVPEARLARILEKLVDAEALEGWVHAGRAKLEASAPFRAARAARTRQEQLRPLFCPEEMNLASDPSPNDAGRAIDVPSAFFVDPRIASRALTIPRPTYDAMLRARKSSFAESGRPDGDHAWLAPVKASADAEAVASRVQDGTIDEEFVLDVLAVDSGNPALSPARCGLLRLVPEDGGEPAAERWPARFARALASSKSQAARELHSNLTDPMRTASWHRARAAAMLDACAKRLLVEDTLPYFDLLTQRRAEVFANEISKNPRGQILEPGFRIVFPDVTPTAIPGALALDRECKVVMASARSASGRIEGD